MSNWIKWKWTPEKPYPETLETRVHVKFRDHEWDNEYCEYCVADYWAPEKDNDHWYQANHFGDIVAYKVVK